VFSYTDPAVMVAKLIGLGEESSRPLEKRMKKTLRGQRRRRLLICRGHKGGAQLMCVKGTLLKQGEVEKGKSMRGTTGMERSSIQHSLTMV